MGMGMAVITTTTTDLNSMSCLANSVIALVGAGWLGCRKGIRDADGDGDGDGGGGRGGGDR